MSDPLQKQYTLLMLSRISSPRRSVLRDRAAGYWGRCLKAALPILWVPIAGVSGVGNNTSWGSFYCVDNIDACQMFMN